MSVSNFLLVCFQAALLFNVVNSAAIGPLGTGIAPFGCNGLAGPYGFGTEFAAPCGFGTKFAGPYGFGTEFAGFGCGAGYNGAFGYGAGFGPYGFGI